MTHKHIDEKMLALCELYTHLNVFLMWCNKIIEQTINEDSSSTLNPKSSFKDMANGKEAWESQETGLYIFYKQSDATESVYRYTINLNPKKSMNSYQIALLSQKVMIANVKTIVLAWDGVWKFWMGITIIVVTTAIQVIACVKVSKQYN